MGERRVGVIGLGLIGGSLLRRLTAEDSVVACGFDINPETLQAARDKGLCTVASLDALVASCDLLIVCVTPDAAGPVCLEALLQSETIVVTDTTSAKAQVIEYVMTRANLDECRRFVPGHPMAGSHKSGFSCSREDLFEQASWVIPIDRRCPPTLDAVVAVSNVADLVGAATLVTNSGQHEFLVAYASHLPYLTACALIDSSPQQLRGLTFALSAEGLRNSTRVAESDPDLWYQILTHNRDAVLHALSYLLADLNRMHQALAAEDGQELRELLAVSHHGRTQLQRRRWTPPDWRAVEVDDPEVEKLIDLCSAGALLRGLQLSQTGVLRGQRSQPATI
jgi:prephenate dehydrogenase